MKYSGSYRRWGVLEGPFAQPLRKQNLAIFPFSPHLLKINWYRMHEAVNNSLLISLNYVPSINEAHGQIRLWDPGTGSEKYHFTFLRRRGKEERGREGCTDQVAQSPQVGVSQSHPKELSQPLWVGTPGACI